MPAAMGAVTPGLFGGSGGGVGGVSVLSEMSGASVLHLGRVHHILSVMRQLDVGGGPGPLVSVPGVGAGVPVGDGRVRGSVCDGARVAERGAVVRVRVRGQVRGLQVRHLRGVDDAAVVGERRRTVFVEACAEIELFSFVLA